MSMHISRIDFGSLLSYSPRGDSEGAQRSRTAMKALKDDEFVVNPPMLMSEFVAVKQKVNWIDFYIILNEGTPS